MIVICAREESPFTYDEIVDLIHLAFLERLRQGLRFTCSDMSVEEFKERMEDGTVVVAYDEDNPHRLLGTMSTHTYKDSHDRPYGYLEYLAVHPSARYLGIASLLLDKCLAIECDGGAEYVLSDTAAGAKSSIKWHHKNGFVIYGYRSYSSTNYYSFLFRKQLIGRSKWDNDLYRLFHFLISFIKTRIKYTRTGEVRRWFSCLSR